LNTGMQYGMTEMEIHQTVEAGNGSSILDETQLQALQQQLATRTQSACTPVN